jgi:hypothetical protein
MLQLKCTEAKGKQPGYRYYSLDPMIQLMQHSHYIIIIAGSLLFFFALNNFFSRSSLQSIQITQLKDGPLKTP